jgi:hypothetical protein
LEAGHEVILLNKKEKDMRAGDFLLSDQKPYIARGIGKHLDAKLDHTLDHGGEELHPVRLQNLPFLAV